MSKLRWIHLLLVLGLVMAVLIAAHPTGTAAAAVQPGTMSRQSAQAAIAQCILTTAEFHSLHGVYIKGENVRLLETNTGPLGFEGGFSALNMCR